MVDILPPEADSSIAMLGADEKPDVAVRSAPAGAFDQKQYSDIGGMDTQKQEMREAVELPLTQFDLYQQVCPVFWISLDYICRSESILLAAY